LRWLTKRVAGCWDKSGPKKKATIACIGVLIGIAIFIATLPYSVIVLMSVILVGILWGFCYDFVTRNK